MNRLEYDKAEIGINWSDRFDELDIDQAVDSSTNFLRSVITQHISNREITCCDRVSPRITDQVKKAIKRKDRVYRKYKEIERLMTGGALSKLKALPQTSA